jgi:peptidoglycan L-alanyl-D-glutamate endopeptidase CwlK
MCVFGQRSKDNLKGIHPDLVRVMNEAIKDTPVDFIITDGVRTTEQQQALYNKGRTKESKEKGEKVVTNCDGIKNKSNHQPKIDGYGHAVDLYPYYNGSVQLNDVAKLRIVADHIKVCAKKLGVKVDWGGDWKSLKDYPHFELAV